MSRAILMSINPEYVAKILNGEKTIEIRKTAPKCNLPVEVYIYCAKGKPYVARMLDVDDVPFYPTIESCVYLDSNTKASEHPELFLNGKVVAKFTLRKVEKFSMANPYEEPTRGLLDKACLTIGEARTYAGGEHPRYKPLYAWHISDLVIFDKPKELNQFQKPGTFKAYKGALEHAEENDVITAEYEDPDMPANEAELTEASYKMGAWGLTKPPQSWCYVEVRHD